MMMNFGLQSYHDDESCHEDESWVNPFSSEYLGDCSIEDTGLGHE